ncbi:hypothetical protein EJ04DRAFT_513681 [Polyplosphaeria fusca]|uniref:Uncharacterized protein n=1 Tax=Polyplosphaeria fusca TaxID=682080 RepID=A0A9P4QRX8_9PLEO|nr:hypothetical protein EJ04DRAFT_513681 [Polyplosphaeria fusca]
MRLLLLLLMLLGSGFAMPQPFAPFPLASPVPAALVNGSSVLSSTICGHGYKGDAVTNFELIRQFYCQVTPFPVA